MVVGLIFFPRFNRLEVQPKLVGLALLVVAGGDDGLLRGRIKSRRRERHDREVTGLIPAHGVGDAVLAIVTDLKDFLKKIMQGLKFLP